MTLSILWFILVAVLWTVYLILEGFDFGVGMLLPFVAKGDRERTQAVRTIGPHWDGNEVWHSSGARRSPPRSGASPGTGRTRSPRGSSRCCWVWPSRTSCRA